MFILQELKKEAESARLVMQAKLELEKSTQRKNLIQYEIDVLIIWDARTRLPGERTCVRRSKTRRRGKDAVDRASVPRRATWRFPNRADAAKIGADATEIGADVAQIGPTRSVSAVSADIGWYRPKRPDLGRNSKKKKKKKVQNAPFDLT